MKLLLIRYERSEEKQFLQLTTFLSFSHMVWITHESVRQMRPSSPAFGIGFVIQTMCEKENRNAIFVMCFEADKGVPVPILIIYATTGHKRLINEFVSHLS